MNLYNRFESILEDSNLFGDARKIVLLSSLGKDCSCMLDCLVRYLISQGRVSLLRVFHVPFPTHMYYSDGVPKDDYKRALQYWAKRGVCIESRTPICDDVVAHRGGCSRCKAARKSVIDPYLSTFPSGTVVMTGFTLNDALSYLNMLLLETGFDLGRFESLPSDRKIQLSKVVHKMIRHESLPDGLEMFRPMLSFGESEIVKYLISRGVPYIGTDCANYEWKFKRHYSKALSAYGNQVTYDDVLKVVRGHGILTYQEFDKFIGMEEDSFFIDC